MKALIQKLIPALLLFFSVESKAVEYLFPCNIEIKRPTTSPVDPGNLRVEAYVENLPLASSDPLKFTWVTLTAPSTGAWKVMFDSTVEFTRRIVTLKFPESPESLGVSYRIGFCYLGPEATDKSPPKDLSRGNYNLDGTIGVGSAADYIPYSGLVSGICDLRNGTSKLARNALELYPTALVSDMSFSVNLGTLTSNGIFFTTALNTATTNVPRYCKINVEVTESVTNPRPYQIDLNQAQVDLQVYKL